MPMPWHFVFWVSLLSLLICGALAGMLTAWIWAFGRFWSGRPLLPDLKPRAVPWGTGSVVLVLFAWLAVNIGVASVYLRLTGARNAHRMPTVTEQMAVVSLINGILLVAIPALLRLTSRATLADLGITRRDLWRQLGAGTMGFLLCAPLVYTINLLAVLLWKENKHPLETMVMAEPTAGIACLAFLSAVVLAPAAEELIFRGVIQGWLTQLFRRPKVRRAHDPDFDVELDPAVAAAALDSGPSPVAPSRVGTGGDMFLEPWAPPGTEERTQDASPGDPPRPPSEPPAGAGDHAPAPRARNRRGAQAPVVITSAIFAAVHLPQWPAPLAIFFLSVGLGVVYQRTGSLIASCVMHALFNGFSTLILFQAVLIGHPADPKAAPTATPPPAAARIPAADDPRVVRSPYARS